MPLYTSYSEETQTQIEEFLENTFGWDEDELVDYNQLSFCNVQAVTSRSLSTTVASVVHPNSLILLPSSA